MNSVGINGFGRFGLHLLRYWIINHTKANFFIKFINDEKLTLDKISEIGTDKDFWKLYIYKL